MKRLLIRTLLVAAVVTALPSVVPAQETRPERDARRAEERAERARERADRDRERAERRLERRTDDQGAHILLGHDYELREGSTASEKIIVVGGAATIEGHAEDDVVVIGGSLRLGPKAVVDGDVSVVGGELDRDAAAQIAGDVDVAHISLPSWSWGWWPVMPSVGRIWWEGAALAFTVGRFVLVLFVSIILVTVAPRWTSTIAARLASGPGVSVVAGFAAEVLFAPALIVLAVALIITIVGIPLLAALPLLMAAFALAWVAGYAVVTGLLGARLRGADWYRDGIRPLDVVIGSFILSSITLVGQLMMVNSGWLMPLAMLVRGTGWTIEYIAWTVGLGAALTAWFRPGPFNPGAPAVPPLPSPSPTVL